MNQDSLPPFQIQKNQPIDSYQREKLSMIWVKVLKVSIINALALILWFLVVSFTYAIFYVIIYSDSAGFHEVFSNFVTSPAAVMVLAFTAWQVVLLILVSFGVINGVIVGLKRSLGLNYISRFVLGFVFGLVSYIIMLIISLIWLEFTHFTVS